MKNFVLPSAVLSLAVLALLAIPAAAQQPAPPSAPAVRSIQINDQEIAVVIELLNISCKTGGFGTCESAMAFRDRLRAAQKPAPEAAKVEPPAEAPKAAPKK